MSGASVAVIHDGCADTPGGAAKVSVALANVLDAPLYVGRTGCLEWYEEETAREVTVYAGRANRLPTMLRDAWVAYQTGKLHLPGYDVVVTSGVPAKFYQPESFQEHVHYTHHPPLRYAEWLGRDTLTGVRGNLRYLVRKSALYADWLEMQRVHEILTNSETTRRRVARHYRREGTVVNPPIEYDDAPVVPADEREDYFVYAGRLGERKRLETLVRAFGDTDERLVIFGDGPLKDRLSSLAAACGADVTLKGFVDSAELVAGLREAKAGVFIPKEEDFGMAIAECLCYGTPLVVADEPNPKYMVTDRDGVRVEPTEAAVAEAVRNFDAGSYDAAAIARAAREQYSAERFEREVSEAVERALAAEQTI